MVCSAGEEQPSRMVRYYVVVGNCQTGPKHPHLCLCHPMHAVFCPKINVICEIVNIMFAQKDIEKTKNYVCCKKNERVQMASFLVLSKVCNENKNSNVLFGLRN